MEYRYIYIYIYFARHGWTNALLRGLRTHGSGTHPSHRLRRQAVTRCAWHDFGAGEAAPSQRPRRVPPHAGSVHAHATHPSTTPPPRGQSISRRARWQAVVTAPTAKVPAAREYAIDRSGHDAEIGRVLRTHDC
jgi:hypothetical protein